MRRRSWSFASCVRRTFRLACLARRQSFASTTSASRSPNWRRERKKPSRASAARRSHNSSKSTKPHTGYGGLTRRMRLACAAIVLTAFTLSPRAAAACVCESSGPPCQNYFHVDAVFVGAVRATALLGSSPDAAFQRQSIVFDVERAFRGVQGPTAELTTSGGDCAYQFKSGERYLVYAYKQPGGGLSTSICSRTRPIRSAAEDLGFIEGLAPLGTGGRVYGVITHRERDLVHGGTRTYDRMPPVDLLLRGRSGAYDARS